MPPQQPGSPPAAVGSVPEHSSQHKPVPDLEPIKIVLEAAAGHTARGMFLVENFLPNPVQGRIVASKLKGCAAEEVELPFIFVPPVAALKPRDQLLAQFSVVIPDTLTPGIFYAGEIAIPELKGTAIPLMVRRLAPAP